MIAENLYEQIFSSDEAFFEGNLPAGLPAEDKTKAGKAGSSATSCQKKQRCMREKDAILKFRNRF
jgi:hypothetical protein